MNFKLFKMQLKGVKVDKILFKSQHRKVNYRRRHFVTFRLFLINSLKECRLAYSSNLGWNVCSQIVPLFKTTTKIPNEKLFYSTNVCSATQTEIKLPKYVLIVSYCITTSILPFLQAVEMILNLFTFSTFVTQNCSRKEKEKGLSKY